MKEEKNRQLRNVEEIKRKELLSWKEKHVTNVTADYYYCLSNVGDAHVAAERENELIEQLNEQQREDRKTAVIRGRKALQIERSKNVKKNERLMKRTPKVNVVHKEVATATQTSFDEENDDILSDDDENQLSESDDTVVEENIDLTHRSLSKSPNRNKSVDKQEVRFSQVSELIEERRRARKLCDQMLETDFGTGKPTTSSKSPEPKSPQGKSIYAPRSPIHKPLYAPKSPPGKPLQSPISHKQTSKSPVGKSPVAVKGPSVTVKGFVPKSHQFSGVSKAATSTNQKINSQRGVTKKVNTPNKVVKPKNSMALKFPLPQRREFVPRFTTNQTAKTGILKNKANPVITPAATTVAPDKVQFYDHFSRYGKEYDPIPGMVIRESQPATVNANEAARIQNDLDEVRFQQLEELK